MKRETFLKRAMAPAVSVLVTALLLTVGLSHRHEGASASSHHSEFCRLCKIQDGFSADSSSPGLVVLVPAPIAVNLAPSHETPRTCVALARSAPRAPPVIS